MAQPFQLLDTPVEETEDGDFLIGTPEEEEIEAPSLREFDSNLALTLDSQVLTEIADQVRMEFDSDNSSREDWLSTYEEGLSAIIGEDYEAEESTRSERNLTDVTHPLIAEAATQFQARAVVELFPAAGP